MPGWKARCRRPRRRGVAFDTGLLLPHECAPVRELAPFPSGRELDRCARAGRSTTSARTLAGYVAFTVRGEAGARVIVEHSEIVDRDSEFDNRNYRSAEARIEYVLKGGGARELPAVLHLPGLPLRARDDRGRGRGRVDRVRADQLGRQATASFSAAIRWSTGWSRTRIWSQRSNFIEVPTDCPQRDERLGWTGDAQVFARDRLLPARQPATSFANGCAT